MVAIKFCGLTRAEDVRMAAALGASFAGVIFAGGPRHRTVAEASALFESAAGMRRVGVVPAADSAMQRTHAEGVALDVLQLHADPTEDDVARARATGTEIWAVARVGEAPLDPAVRRLFQVADAVVLDTRGDGPRGGTGRTFDWRRVASEIATFPRSAQLVIAGGLDPFNVAEAIRVLAPDIVDVSSGVERAPGIKNHDLMQRFVEAVRSV